MRVFYTVAQVSKRGYCDNDPLDFCNPIVIMYNVWKTVALIYRLN